VFVINADESSPRSIAKADQGIDPSWFPDGQRFAYVKNGNPCCKAYIIGVDGRGKTPVKRGGVHRSTEVSPDGTQLLFMSEATTSTNAKFKTAIFIQDLSTGRLRELPATRGCTSWPRWSPDAAVVFFTSCRRDSSGHSIYKSETIMWAAADGHGAAHPVMPMHNDITHLAVMPAPVVLTSTPMPIPTRASQASTSPSIEPSPGASGTASADKSSSHGGPIAIAAVLLALVATAAAVAYRRARTT
jgi:hypothetical protein